MEVLFVDDMESRYNAARSYFPEDTRITWVSTPDQAAIMAMMPWDVVCLDHDAGMYGEEEVNFLPVACVVALNDEVQRVIVHTGNKPAGDRMEQILTEWGKTVERKFFKLPSGELVDVE